MLRQQTDKLLTIIIIGTFRAFRFTPSSYQNMYPPALVSGIQ
jgi:hypothetical protein